MLAIAAILGIFEGLTEFLPVSSTGHLIIAGHLLNFTGERAATFEIFIQLGAILAVLGIFRQKFIDLFSFKSGQGFSGKNGIIMLIMTTLPALIFGAGLHHTIKEYLFNPVSVAIGLLIGSAWILFMEFKPRPVTKDGLDSLTGRDALLIGMFQCLAMWPGMSRAAATILGAMFLGFNRKTATEYSFFAAVPVICAATILDLVKSLDILEVSDIPLFAVGFVVAMISAWAAVKFFIGYVSRNTLMPFAVYRIALAIAVLVIWKS